MSWLVGADGDDVLSYTFAKYYGTNFMRMLIHKEQPTAPRGVPQEERNPSLMAPGEAGGCD
jgi:hypothetical protein